MQSYPSPSIEILGKEQAFFHLKCKAISSTNLPLHEEGTKLFFLKCTVILPTNPSHKGKELKVSSLECTAILSCRPPFPTWGRSQASSSWKDLTFLPPKYMAILDHMGKESSFLPPEMQIYPSPHGEGVMRASMRISIFESMSI